MEVVFPLKKTKSLLYFYSLKCLICSAHRHGRVVIEQTNGQIKMKFPCLRKGLRVAPKKPAKSSLPVPSFSTSPRYSTSLIWDDRGNLRLLTSQTTMTKAQTSTLETPQELGWLTLSFSNDWYWHFYPCIFPILVIGL